MKITIALAAFLLFTNFACGQNDKKPITDSSIKVSDGCEDCEALYDSPVPLERLPHIDTLPDFVKHILSLKFQELFTSKTGSLRQTIL